MIRDENAEVFCQPAFDRNNSLMGKFRRDSNTRNSTTFCLGCNKGKRFNDSLYQGYPIGYLIAWCNPNVKLKDGTTAEGKKILIDGQQRVTALTAAILGDYVINKDYKRVKIKIAFNPLEEKFEVLNTAIERDSSWLPDISKIISGDVDVLDLLDNYCSKNENVDRSFIYKKIESLRKITQKQLGLIELDSDLDIEIVAEIFIRINSKGVGLSQADFAMSKIAANESYGGSNLRTLTPHHVGDMSHQIPRDILSFAVQTLNRTATIVFSYSPYREYVCVFKKQS